MIYSIFIPKGLGLNVTSTQICLQLYLIMELDRQEHQDEILIYDIESENNEPPLQCRDDPEPQSALAESIDVLHTQSVQIRSHSSHPFQKEEPSKLKIETIHTYKQSYPKSELKQQARRYHHRIKEDYKQLQKKQEQMPHYQNDPQNIIFYDEDLLKSTASIEYSQSTRGFLKNVLESSDEEDSDQYEDEVQDLQHISSMKRGEKVKAITRDCSTDKTGRRVSGNRKDTNENAIGIQASVDVLIQQLLPEGYKLRCYLTIQRGLLGFASCYRLFLGEQKQFLMSAKKETFKYYSNFLISKHPQQIHKRSDIYLGRLQANFIGTEFKLFHSKDKAQNLSLVITYNKNIAGFMGPRIFSVLKVNPTKKPSKYSLNTLSSILQRNQLSKLLKLQTVQPVLIRGKYRLNFEGKVRIPSSKNFILDGHSLTEENSLLFGKVSEDCYMMEVAYPLTIFQAFGVCLTSLDRKIMVN